MEILRIVVPERCELSAVGFYESDGTLKVAQPIYSRLSSTDRAAFILHEAIYKLARETFQAQTSFHSRNLNSALFSSNVSSDEIRSLRTEALGFEKNNGTFVSPFPANSDLTLHIKPGSETNSYSTRIYCANRQGHEQGNPILVQFEGKGEQSISFRDRNCNMLTLSHAPERDTYPPASTFTLKLGERTLWTSMGGYVRTTLYTPHTVELPEFS